LSARSLVCFLLLIAAVLVGATRAQTPGQGTSASLSVIARDGRRPLAFTVVNGQEMVALSDLADLFQLAVFEDALAGGVTVTYKGRSIVLTAGQTLASVAGRLVSLPAPTQHDQRVWRVPVEFINRALALIYDARLELRKDSRLVIVGELRVPRVVVRHEPAGADTRIVIDISPRTNLTLTQEPGRLVVRLDADALDPRIPPMAADPLVESIRVSEPNAIAVALTPRFATYRGLETPADAGALRYVLELSPAGAQPPIAEPVAPAPAPDPPLTFEPASPSGLRTIVIDPGHGGEDTGAKGANGGLEKNVTLSVARRLKAVIEGRLGLRVLLTREADRAMRLDERAALANNNKADLFLSLHANASVRPSVRGAEVFYLSLAEYGDEAQRLAAQDSQALPVFGGGTRPIDVIPWDMAQARHIDRSVVFAKTIEARFRGTIEMSPRALAAAPFRVLVGANMPAALVEMGFITNAEQERQLASDAFQASIVQALYESIVGFRDATGGPRPATGTSGAVGASGYPVEPSER
jgi:N-acetylmuramoyl-L-alanine amidase